MIADRWIRYPSLTGVNVTGTVRVSQAAGEGGFGNELSDRKTAGRRQIFEGTYRRAGPLSLAPHHFGYRFWKHSSNFSVFFPSIYFPGLYRSERGSFLALRCVSSSSHRLRAVRGGRLWGEGPGLSAALRQTIDGDNTEERSDGRSYTSCL